MRRKCARAALVAVLTALFVASGTQLAAAEEGALDRIARTGELRVGMREAAPPFASIDETGSHAGFSVDMAYLLAEKLSEYAGKDIQVKEVTVTPTTRIPVVTSGVVDIEMGSTSMTAARELVVDFTLPFFVSETNFMVRADSDIHSLEDLDGKIVAAAEGTTNLKALREAADGDVFSPLRIVVADTHSKGSLALQQGRIDAYFTDGSLLAGLQSAAKDPSRYTIVEDPIHLEPYGWIVREGDSDWRDFVNHFFIWTLNTGIFYDVYDEWMGPASDTVIPRSEAYEHYLLMVRWPGVASVWPTEE